MAKQTPHRVGATIAAAAAIMIMGACSAADTPASPTAQPPAVDTVAGGGEAAAPGAAAVGAAGDAATGAGAANKPQVPAIARALIYTGSITVTADDVRAAADRAIAIAGRAGGLIDSDRRTIDGDRTEAELTLRVPANSFSGVLDELSRLGVEQARSAQTQDVTEAVVDLDARLATQRASVNRVRALLARANTIGEVVSLEAEVTRREADLASLTQRREALAGLVALSTITLRLRGPDAPSTTAEPRTGFLAGLANGWNGFLVSVSVVLTVAGWLLPWVIALGVPLWLIVWRVRHKRRVRP